MDRMGGKSSFAASQLRRDRSRIEVRGARLSRGGQMSKSQELSLALRVFLKTYRWRRIDPVPSASLVKPIAESRVGLVSSAGLVVPGDPPFDEVRGGDFSYRIIPSDVDVRSLEDHHRSDSFDHSGVKADRNMGLPLDRLHELASAGDIGAVAPRHISLMGSITAPGRFMKQTLPEISDLLVADEVDVALLVPV
jgi:D-proline reductase (dithiol) PrdB